LISSFPTNGTRFRSNTTSKGKKGMLGFMSELLNSNKRLEISTPYDPVHLTHVGFNTSTGEFTGLPKEWQQLLQDSGISRMEQEKNPEAVFEIVKFYQEGGGDVWDKMGAAVKSQVSSAPLQRHLVEEALYSPVSTRSSCLRSHILRVSTISAQPLHLPRNCRHHQCRQLPRVDRAQLLLTLLRELLPHLPLGLIRL
jgi:hypothetical protein